MSATRVDVVVLTWNDGADAEVAVRSALSSRDVDVRVQVVDNGSTIAFQAPEDPRVRVLRSDTNLGVGGGRNLGASAGDAPLLCFLDSDARLEPSSLLRLVTEMEGSAQVGLVAPVFADQAPEIGAGRAPSPLRKVARGLGLTERYARTRRPGQQSWDIEFAIGACQLVRRVAFDEVAGIDARDRFGPEDVDFCLRLGEAGWRCRQVGDSICHHRARRSSRRLLSRRGLAHLAALVRHYRRHRHHPARTGA